MDGLNIHKNKTCGKYDLGRWKLEVRIWLRTKIHEPRDKKERAENDSRITTQVSRLPSHALRLTPHDSRFTKCEV